MKWIIEPATLIDDLLACASATDLVRTWWLIGSGPDDNELQLLQSVRRNVPPACGSSLGFWSAKNLNFKLF